MKKTIAVLLIIISVFLCSCKKTDSEETTADANESTSFVEELEVSTELSLNAEEIDPASVLCVYFSHNDCVDDTAEFISEKTEAELLKIETLGVYPEDSEALIKKAQEEHNKNFRPALKNAPRGLSEYDIIFMCFPEWDNTMPMALFTFIEDYDMREKAVIPVIWGDSEALDNASADIRRLVPSMMIVSGYHFTDELTDEVKADMEKWINTALYG